MISTLSTQKFWPGQCWEKAKERQLTVTQLFFSGVNITFHTYTTNTYVTVLDMIYLLELTLWNLVPSHPSTFFLPIVPQI